MFFSEQQAVSEPPDNSPPPHLPNSNVAISQILLNPLFIAHLLTWIILLSLFVVALMDIMLKLYFTRVQLMFTFLVHTSIAEKQKFHHGSYQVIIQLSRSHDHNNNNVIISIIKKNCRHTTFDVYIQGATDLPLSLYVCQNEWKEL